MKKIICDFCDQEMVWVKVDEFDYSRLAGFDPARVRVVLERLNGLECECGFSPAFSDVTGLQVTIALALIGSGRPLVGDDARLLRKHIFMTQEQFSRLFELTPQHYSLWETGRKQPPRSTQLAAAVAFMGACLRDDDHRHIDRTLFLEALERMTSPEPADSNGEIRLSYRETAEDGEPRGWRVVD
jgi:hypothetical protein